MKPTKRILNLEPFGYDNKARRILESLGEVDDGPKTRSELLACVGLYDIILVRLSHRIDAEVIDRADRLSYLVTTTTGLDHIDVEVCERKGIEVLSLQGETEFLKTITSTAEMTWGLILALARHLPAATRHVEEGGWDRDSFRGTELQDKTIGIVGMGRVGSIAADYALAFRMKVQFFDPTRRECPSGVYRAESLDELLATSDILTLHVPLTFETKGMIGRDQIRRLPRGALLVNTSRGALIDESAVIEALADGHLGGAALDVLSDESEIGDAGAPVIEHARRIDNLIITPHLGGNTFEAMAKTERFMALKLAQHLSAG